MNVLTTKIHDAFTVSTIYRKSSVFGFGEEMAYYETCVFKTGEQGKLGTMLQQFASTSQDSAMQSHQRFVNEYFQAARFDEERAKEDWRSLDRMYSEGT